ncbi:hypothetical protein ACFQ0B_21145 [Nonomuraea thailandensis]
MEALEHWAGEDLPWSDDRHLARLGVEYRNDLIGHCTAFGLREPPRRYHSGFRDTADWPPNAVALEELRALGGVTGYGHPFHTPFDDDDPPDIAIDRGRSCAARRSWPTRRWASSTPSTCSTTPRSRPPPPSTAA